MHARKTEVEEENDGKHRGAQDHESVMFASLLFNISNAARTTYLAII